MVRLQDDFYEAINGEWEKTAVIPNDKPRTGGFSDLSDEIEERCPFQSRGPGNEPTAHRRCTA